MKDGSVRKVRQRFFNFFKKKNCVETSSPVKQRHFVTNFLSSLTKTPQKGRKESFLFYQFNFARFPSPVIAAEPLFSLVSFLHPKMERGFRLKFKALHFTAGNSGQIHYREKKWKYVSQEKRSLNAMPGRDSISIHVYINSLKALPGRYAKFSITFLAV